MTVKTPYSTMGVRLNASVPALNPPYREPKAENPFSDSIDSSEDT